MKSVLGWKAENIRNSQRTWEYQWMLEVIVDKFLEDVESIVELEKAEMGLFICA